MYKQVLINAKQQMENEVKNRADWEKYIKKGDGQHWAVVPSTEEKEEEGGGEEEEGTRSRRSAEEEEQQEGGGRGAGEWRRKRSRRVE